VRKTKAYNVLTAIGSFLHCSDDMPKEEHAEKISPAETDGQLLNLSIGEERLLVLLSFIFMLGQVVSAALNIWAASTDRPGGVGHYLTTP